jgi:hypothetical protein
LARRWMALSLPAPLDGVRTRLHRVYMYIL